MNCKDIVLIEAFYWSIVTRLEFKSNKMVADGSLEGILKQQCQDENGLFNWQKKLFRLNSLTGNLSIIDNSTEVSSTSLYGAKYAKEWSFSSVLAGYGFDIVWGNGNLWSFLVDDEKTCYNWVTSVNKIIGFSDERDLISESIVPLSTTLPKTEPRSPIASKETQEQNTLVLLRSSIATSPSPAKPSKNVTKLPARKDKKSPSGKSPWKASSSNPFETSHSPIPANLSGFKATHTLSNNENSNSDKSSSPISNDEQPLLKQSVLEHEYIPGHDSLPGKGSEGYIHNVKDIFAKTKQTLLTSSAEFDRVNEKEVSSNHVFSLQLRCQHLEHLLEKKQVEVQYAQEKVSMMQQDYDVAIANYESQIEQLKERERLNKMVYSFPFALKYHIHSYMDTVHTCMCVD